jgi:hypothetical protein
MNDCIAKVTSETQTGNPRGAIVAICEHIKDDGHRCGTPAIRGRHFCYFHSRAHQPAARIGDRYYRSSLPETVESLQIAVAEVLQALGRDDIAPKKAGSMLYGIHIATRILHMSQKTAKSTNPVVTEVPAAMEEVLCVTSPSINRPTQSAVPIATADPNTCLPAEQIVTSSEDPTPAPPEENASAVPDSQVAPSSDLRQPPAASDNGTRYDESRFSPSQLRIIRRWAMNKYGRDHGEIELPGNASVYLSPVPPNETSS